MRIFLEFVTLAKLEKKIRNNSKKIKMLRIGTTNVCWYHSEGTILNFNGVFQNCTNVWC